MKLEIVVLSCHGCVPGDSGDGALGGNEGEMRGPNNLVSGDFDGAGAGLGNIVAAGYRGVRIYTKET